MPHRPVSRSHHNDKGRKRREDGKRLAVSDWEDRSETSRPRQPETGTPARMPGSVRRTSTIDVDWPEGRGGPMHVVARARDLLTSQVGKAIVQGQGGYDAILDAERRILSIAADDPRLPPLAMLTGEKAGSRLRSAIAHHLPEEKRAGTPLYLILDDLAGASLVAPWAWSCWDADWAAEMARLKSDPRIAAIFKSKENICAGLATGSSGLAFGAEGTRAGALDDGSDPLGWHAFPEPVGTAFQRARRIDVRLDGPLLIDAHFRDSASTPEGTQRSVVHEYRLRATADPASLTLLSVEAQPRVLPFPECLGAVANATRLIGTPLADLRETVLVELRGTAGCTHLNDALRALAEVPAMLATVP